MPDSVLVFQRLATDKAIGAIEDAQDFAVVQGAFRLLPTETKSIIIPQFDTNDLLRCEFGFVGADGSYPEAELAMEEISYLLKKAGLDQPVFDGDEDEISNIVETKVQTGVVKAYRFVEKLMASKVLVANAFNEDKTGVSGTPSTNQFKVWSDRSNSTPIQDVKTYKKDIHSKTGLTADSLLVTGDVDTALMEHPDILGRLSVMTTQVGTPELVAFILGIKNYYVANGVENTSNKGNTTQTKGFIASDSALLYHRGNSDDKSTPAAARIAYKKQEGGRLVAGYTLRDDVKEKDIVRTKANFTVGVQNKDLGMFLTNVL